MTSENGELDYKKLYEESQAENERLREKLRRSDEQLREVRGLLDKAQSTQNKNNLSEMEKRERRAMERKLSEMEEELKVRFYSIHMIIKFLKKSSVSNIIQFTSIYLFISKRYSM